MSEQFHLYTCIFREHRFHTELFCTDDLYFLFFTFVLFFDEFFVKLTDQLRFLPEESYTAPAAWCDVMEQALSVGRRDGRDAVCAGGYDIRRQARRLESLYLHGTLPSQEL